MFSSFSFSSKFVLHLSFPGISCLVVPGPGDGGKLSSDVGDLEQLLSLVNSQMEGAQALLHLRQLLVPNDNVRTALIFSSSLSFSMRINTLLCCMATSAIITEVLVHTASILLCQHIHFLYVHCTRTSVIMVCGMAHRLAYASFCMRINFTQQAVHHTVHVRALVW